jgi:hypothetical protein
MGLDVYVGSLTRYYTGQWQTIIQQAAEQKGEKVEIVYTNRPAVPPDAAPPRPSWAEAPQTVEAWRQFLSEQLEDHIQAPLEWDESEAAPYFTDKPGWDGFLALKLWAAYSDNPKLARPSELPEDPTVDPALEASRERMMSSRYPHLLLDAEVWLPVDFASLPDAASRRERDRGGLGASARSPSEALVTRARGGPSRRRSRWTGRPGGRRAARPLRAFGFALCWVGPAGGRAPPGDAPGLLSRFSAASIRPRSSSWTAGPVEAAADARRRRGGGQVRRRLQPGDPMRGGHGHRRGVSASWIRRARAWSPATRRGEGGRRPRRAVGHGQDPATAPTRGRDRRRARSRKPRRTWRHRGGCANRSTSPLDSFIPTMRGWSATAAARPAGGGPVTAGKAQRHRYRGGVGHRFVVAPAPRSLRFEIGGAITSAASARRRLPGR